MVKTNLLAHFGCGVSADNRFLETIQSAFFLNETKNRIIKNLFSLEELAVMVTFLNRALLLAKKSMLLLKKQMKSPKQKMLNSHFVKIKLMPKTLILLPTKQFTKKPNKMRL